MGRKAETEKITEADTATVLNIEHIRAHVSPGGDFTDFEVKYVGLDAVTVRVPFSEYHKLMHEVRNASSVMMTRQRNLVDKGRRHIVELIDSAFTPADISVLIDRETFDRILVLQFADNAPMTIRVSARGVDRLFNEITDAIATAKGRTN